MLRDLRFAWRSLLRAPRVLVSAIVTLSIAVAGVGALLSVLNAVVLRPLAMPHAGQLALVVATEDGGRQGFIPVKVLQALEGAQDVFETFAGYSGNGGGTQMEVDLAGSVFLVSVEAVTPTYFRVMGARPLMGRLFDAATPSTPDDARGIVVSYEFWQRELKGDPSVVGRTVRLSGALLTIIGVTEPAMPVLTVEQRPAFMIPLDLLPVLVRTPEVHRAYYVVARLRPGVTRERAEARLNDLWPAVLETAAAGDAKLRATFQRFSRIKVAPGAHGISPLRQRYTAPLSLVLTLATILVVVACLNIGGMWLVGVVVRQSELQTRLMLGATSSQVTRLLLIESLIVALVATAVAIPLSFWMIGGLRSMLWTGSLPLTLDITPDRRVLTMMAGIGLGCGLLSAAPAVAFWRLRYARRSSSTRTVVGGVGWLGRGVVVAQLALSVMVLHTAGVCLANLASLKAIDPGYRTSGWFWTRVSPIPGTPAQQPTAESIAYFRQVLDQLRAQPGVTSVALSQVFPTVTAKSTPSVIVNRADASGNDGSVQAFVDFVSPEFFGTAGIPLITGRDFDAGDDTRRAPIAMINSTMAQQLFGSEPALGQRVRVASGKEPVEIVGVVRDASPGDVRIAAAPQLYRPIFQEPAYLRLPVISLRATDDGHLGERVRATVTALGRHRVWSFRSIETHIEQALAAERVMFWLSLFVSGLALALSCIGLYALVSYICLSKVRELGLRMALGASTAMVRGMIVRDAGALIAIGLVVGVPLAVAGLRSMRAMLVDLPPFQLQVLAGASALLLASALAATILPARRAARVDPAVALRES